MIFTHWLRQLVGGHSSVRRRQAWNGAAFVSSPRFEGQQRGASGGPVEQLETRVLLATVQASQDVSIAASTDDAEENISTGAVNLISTDLELIRDGSTDQTVGLRFTNLEIPSGATVRNAYVQFQVDEVSTSAASLVIQAQAASNAATFSTATSNISSRPTTTASVAWTPPAWNAVGDAGVDQRTPDLTSVIQEVVDRPNWLAGNSLALIVTGSGRRTAEAIDDGDSAPVLHLEWEFSTIEEARVGSGSDDAEENNVDGVVNISSTDLELTRDGNAGANGLFDLAMNFPGGLTPRNIVASDLDGDGDSDLAGTNRDANTAFAMLNNGDGSFAVPATYPIGSFPGMIVAADLNGDGFRDLAAANFNTNNVSILLNNGNGTFGTATNIAVGQNPDGIAAGDLDGDGDVDLAVGNRNANNVTVLLNNGNGTFASGGNPAVGNFPSAVTAADLDRDGDLDLAISNANSNNLSVLLNSGNATFAQAVNYSVANAPANLTQGDLDADGDIDLLTASFVSPNISALLNNGDGTFVAAINSPVGFPNGGQAIAVGDFDSDGNLDVVLPISVSTTAVVLRGNGNGTFGAGINLTVGNDPEGAVAADFDGDSEVDIAVANVGDNNVSVLLNSADFLQTVGVRFNQVAVPQGVTITNAYVQFQVDEADSEATSLTIRGQAADDASAFTTSAMNISSRPTTAANVAWNPATWNTVGDAGVDQRTPDLTAVIQEIVGRPGWSIDNAVVLVVTGTGQRVAESFDGDSAAAPLLHVEWDETTFVQPQFRVKHAPYLQLGNAALGSATDQIEIVWQTVPAGGGTEDSFTVEYRRVGDLTFSSGGAVGTLPTGVEGRINHSSVIAGLAHNTDYEYRVTHLRRSNVVAIYQDTFRTRKPAGDATPFTFVAYGDSAGLSSIDNFRAVKNRINLLDAVQPVAFSLLLGDNAYENGTHPDFDSRLDPTLSPESAQYMASHVDFPAIGNHDIRTAGGRPTEDNYSVPLNGPATGETAEHNYSFDYGDIHFATFDSNSLDDPVRLDNQLDWLEADMQASTANWKVVFVHHPIGGSPDKSEGPSDNYYQQVVSRLRGVGVDVFMAGHSHLYHWTYPLLGQSGGQATFVLDTDRDYARGAGLVQVVPGTGGRDLRDGDFTQFPFDAAGYSNETNTPVEFGFAKVDVTPSRLTVSYIAADDGAVIDSFSITIAAADYDFGDAPDSGTGTGTGNYQTLSSDNGPQHGIFAGLQLGANVDDEADALPSDDALGDDVDNSLPDDEDGVAFPQADLVLADGTAPQVSLFVTNTFGLPATLYGWIDYDADGVFDNGTERAQVTVADGTDNGIVTLTFPAVPGGSAGSTYARFRLSTDVAAANPTGTAVDGEVEDYVVTISRPSTGLVASESKISATSGNFTGSLDDFDFFGGSVAALGDLDGDGVGDVAVGAYLDDDGGASRGAVWVLFLNSNGTVKSHQKISATDGGFTGALDNSDFFGRAVAALGDLDGDGVTDLAVGAPLDDDGGNAKGAVWILNLNADGTVKDQQKISQTDGNFTGTVDSQDFFGQSLAAVGDWDGDGISELAVGAARDDDGGADRGAVWVLFLDSDGTVKSHQKISDVAGTIGLDNADFFGSSVAALGDLDGDGVSELAAGAHLDDDGGSGNYAERGAVWVLFPNRDGTLKSRQKISSTSGNFTGALDDRDYLGWSVAGIGDLNGDGVSDLAAGAILDDDGGMNRGAVWVLFLNSDGTVNASQKLSDSEGNFNGTLDNVDLFAGALATLGDLNGDGVQELAVGALLDDDGGTNRGAVWVLFLDVVQVMDLALDKTVDNAAPNIGGNVTFTLALNNTGSVAASGVQVTDLLPAGLSFVNFTASQGMYDGGTGVWIVGNVGGGASATLQIVATVTSAGTKVNSAEVTAADQADVDSTPNNNVPGEDDQDSVTVTPPQADLSLTKSVNDAAPNIGDVVAFTITLANSGPNAAGGVQVADLLPAGLTFVSATPSQGSYSSGSGVWTVGSVAASGGATLRIDARVATIGAKSNTAEVTASSPFDPDSTPNNGVAGEDDQATVTLVPQQADLSLTKIADNNSPNVGSNVTFTLTLTNSGPDAASGVQVTDLLPAGLTFVGATTSQGSYSSGTGVWNVGSFAANSSATLQITANVAAAGTKTNTGELTAADQFDPDSTPNNGAAGEDDQAAATVTPPQADLSVSKTVDNAAPNVGNNVTFTLTLSNSGPNAASGVEVNDLLPLGLSFAGVTASQGSYDSGSGAWSVGGVAAGASATLQIVATVATSAAATNSAEVTAADQFDPDSTPANGVAGEDDQAAATVTPRLADLSLAKTVDNAAPNVGSNVTFTLTLNNAGPDAASGVQVFDLLPSGLTFVSATASQGGYNSGSGAWTVGAVAGSANATLQITASVDSVGAKTNLAEVTASNQFDPDSTPNNGVAGEDDQAAATVNPRRADLSLTKSVNDAAPNVGDNVTFTLTLSNFGPDAASGVQVSDLLPSGLTFVDATASQGSYDNGTGAWIVGGVASSTSATLQITASVDSAGAKTNAAELTASDQFDPDSTPNNGVAGEDDQAAATVTPQQADVSLTKIVDNAAPNVGETVTFTITVSNGGPNAASGVRVSDLLPMGLNFLGAVPSQGTYNSPAGAWDVGTVPGSGSASLQITAMVATIAAVTNVAELTAADQFDPDSTPGNGVAGEDDQAAATVTPPQADLSLVKTVDNATPFLGQNVNFSLTLVNGGPDPASGVRVVDLIPAGFTFVSATASQGIYDFGTGLWIVGSLTGTATLDITVTADVEGLMTNTAEVTASDQFDPDSTPNNANFSEDDQDSVTITVVVRQADLSLTKSVDVAAPNVGDNVTFTLILSNAGPDSVSGVAVTDLLPAGLAFVSATAFQGTYDDGTGVWDVGGVASDSGVTLQITATVTSAGAKTNVAEVTAATQRDPDSTPNNGVAGEDDQASVTVTPQQADLSLALTVDDNRPNVGDAVTFTVNLANAGPNAASAVQVRSLLPSGLLFVSAAPSQGSYFSSTGVWSVGNVVVNASLQIVATVASSATTTITAEVTAADQFDPDSTPNNNVASEDDQDSVTITPRQADLLLSKTVGNATPNVGDDVVFTITLGNSGPDAADSVQVTDRLPAGLTFVDAVSSRGSYDSGSGVWSVGTVAGGGSESLFITATVRSGAATTNTAEVTAADQFDPDSTPNNNAAAEDDQDSATVTPQRADLSLTKTVDNASPEVGGNVTFTITVTNAGPDAANGVDVTDVLPLSLTFVTSTVSQGVYDAGSGLWTIGTVPVGGNVTLLITATVAAEGVATNTAGVTATDQFDPDSTPNNNAPAEDDQDSAAVSTSRRDFGDAPAPYPTTLALGANHVGIGPTLGANRDHEDDGQPSPGADGDDTTGTPDDEDGVTFSLLAVSAVAPTPGSVTVDLQNPNAAGNKLDAWIDFNRNGSWDDPGEHVFASYQLGTTAGPRTLDFTIPAGAAAGQTYARFRLSTTGGLAPTGAAADGEVEDYQVTLFASGGLIPDPENPLKTALLIVGTSANDKIWFHPSGIAVRVEINGVNRGVFQPTGRIIVLGLAGNDNIQVRNDSITVPVLFRGGPGTDHLRGGGGDDILLGEAGDDELVRGRLGRDLLIGGAGADYLRGRDQGDILIAGTTDFDNSDAALFDIAREWSRTDADYATRVAHLRGTLAGGLNGATKLVAQSTVHDDGASDRLEGGSDLDWFFARVTTGVADTVFKNADEFLDEI